MHEALSGPAGAVRRRRGVAWLHDADKCSAARARAGSAEAHTARTCTPGRFRLQHARELSVAARCARVVSGFNSSRPRRVVFVGDSFARHAYVAFALALSGDYSTGALNPNSKRHQRICEEGGQFTEKGGLPCSLCVSVSCCCTIAPDPPPHSYHSSRHRLPITDCAQDASL